MKYLGWTVFIFFAVGVGIYPFLYFFLDMSQGFLSVKPKDVLDSQLWTVAFYTHITLGGVALLTGWSQFSKQLRNQQLVLHRTLGKVYVVSVLISGVAGFYIALFATGGIVSIAGFSGLAIAWLFTCIQAYLAIRKREITQHQYWMIRCYAVCWAAVTLRIMLPASQIAGIEFVTAYRFIAWLCWVPNLLVAELIVRNLKATKVIPLPR